ncbi:MAG: hypothetical protein AAF555_06490 [Verrucomicrobiota bacterium]
MKFSPRFLPFLFALTPTTWAEEAADYFPLQAGNQWLYSDTWNDFETGERFADTFLDKVQFVRTVEGQVEGHVVSVYFDEYSSFGDAFYGDHYRFTIRLDGRTAHWSQEEETVGFEPYFVLAEKEGETFPLYDGGTTATVLGREEIAVPAGLFLCYVVEHSTELDPNDENSWGPPGALKEIITEYWAKNVGQIKMVYRYQLADGSLADGETIELLEATIGGKKIGS